MFRRSSNLLNKWRLKKERKPLVLHGARQVGKTWLLKKFGSENFDTLHYFNFEKDKSLHHVFDIDLVPDRILRDLSIILGKDIGPEDLLVFDEIQACPNALTSLKYFCEDKPDVFLCAAGSLIGLELSQGSFPVGKVEFLEVFPLDFEEFLLANNEERMASYLASLGKEEDISLPVHQRLFELLKSYFCVGGLPEAVQTWIGAKDRQVEAFQLVREKQDLLLKTYLADIAKHSGKQNAMHIQRLMLSIPEQLARSSDSSSKRFIFKDVIPGIRGYERLVGAIDWLEKAGLILKAQIVERPQIPLLAFAKENLFKLYFFDVGLLGALANIPPASIWQYEYGTYKGYFAENFVAQEFHSDGVPLFSWKEKEWELEFLLQDARGIIPIEVKAGKTKVSASLRSFIRKYQVDTGVVLSGHGAQERRSGVIMRYPLYQAKYLKRFFL